MKGVGYKLADGSYSGEYLLGSKFTIIGMGFSQPFGLGDVVTLEYNDGSSCPRFTKGGVSQHGYISWECLKPLSPIKDSSTFTKDMLVPGKHLVETENGDTFFVMDGWLKDTKTMDVGWMCFESLSEELVCGENEDCTVIKVYDISPKNNKWTLEGNKELIWERKSKKKEWYEDIPEEGYLCWVWDEDDSYEVPDVVCEYTKGVKHPFLTKYSKNIYEYATPIKTEELNFYKEEEA